jgi:hypothetical protein
LLQAAVALREIEGVDRIAAARAPEQARVLVAHHLPDRAAEALALRFVQHGELVQVHARILAGEDDRDAVVLADVGAVQARAIEVIRQQLAAEGRFDERAQAVEVERVPGGGR